MKRSPQRRRTYRSDSAQTCCRCLQPIPPGTSFHRDLTHAPMHPNCRRLRITPPVDRPRFQFDPAVGQNCDGCDMPIHPGDEVVHVLARPWHAECRKRR